MSITDSEWEHVALVPTRRLGSLLSAARASHGLTLAEVAERSGGAFSTAALASIERGTVSSTDTDLRTLSVLYGVEATSLVPARSKLVIDLDEGLIAIENQRAKISRRHPDRDDVLSRYLAMVYSMRHLEPGTQIPLRIDDIDVLGQALRLGTRTVEADLQSLMSNPRDAVGWRARALRRRVLIPAAGVLVALCGTGALVLVSSDSSVRSGSSLHNGVQATSSMPVEAQIGTAIVQERAADGTPGPMVARLATSGGDVVTSSTTIERVPVSLIDPVTQVRDRSSH